MKRRGSMLVAVLLVVTLSTLATTAMLLSVRTEVASSRASGTRAQARAAAWSGVQAVMAELTSQREALLDGGLPTVRESWTLATLGEGRWVVRLVGVEGAEGESIVSEAGKLNVNVATIEMLTALEAIGAERGDRIVAAREAAPFQSELSLVGAAGMGASDGAGGGVGTEDGEADWRSLVTVLSFDPNVQCGVGEGGSEHRGRRRVNLNLPWSDRLREAIAQRWDDDVAEGIRRIMEQGTKFERDSDIVRVMRFFNLDPAEWPEILDALTTSRDDYVPGRIDVNRAPAEVLACVPGLDRATAEAIVSTRQRLSPEDRSSHAWPAMQGIVAPEQFERAVDWLTVRSMQWRVVVEAGFATGGDGGPGADEFGVASTGERDSSEVLTSVVRLEAVIDVASERPRVAYLRDVTMLPYASIGAVMNGEEPGAAAAGARESLAEPEAGSVAEDRRPVDGIGSRVPADTEADPPESVDPDDEVMETDVPDVAEPTDGASDAGVDRRIGRWRAGRGGS